MSDNIQWMEESQGECKKVPYKGWKGLREKDVEREIKSIKTERDAICTIEIKGKKKNW